MAAGIAHRMKQHLVAAFATPPELRCPMDGAGGVDRDEQPIDRAIDVRHASKFMKVAPKDSPVIFGRGEVYSVWYAERGFVLEEGRLESHFFGSPSLTADLRKFNITTAAWQLLPAYGTIPRVAGTNNPAAVCVDSTIYVVLPNNTFVAFSLATSMWLSNPPTPPSTVGKAAPLVLGESVYFAGGETDPAGVATLVVLDRGLIVGVRVSWRTVQHPRHLMRRLHGNFFHPLGAIADGVAAVVVIILAAGAYGFWRTRNPTILEVYGPEESSFALHLCSIAPGIRLRDRLRTDPPTKGGIGVTLGDEIVFGPRAETSSTTLAPFHRRNPPPIALNFAVLPSRPTACAGIPRRSAFGDGWTYVDNVTMGISGLAPLPAIEIGNDFRKSP
ncbi:hypothetical protein BDK51DRAFT_42766 [Blyttiomyces helicus]|uniref:Uncharacterized protein n=1 Tax=Blyttiomyces helicus TaxID=388810 RepID=A0A4P9WM90_9FUNG|nr:hypothetical protein BDK51DRAFT_42766 [Blyttiomyces helicus]|eukprot:RKO91826.1 hypothetical protein BDK51DRAFT_42766 [Blyttiomyces helicus]